MVTKAHGIAALVTAAGIAVAPTLAWVTGNTPSPAEFDTGDLPMTLVAIGVLFKLALDGAIKVSNQVFAWRQPKERKDLNPPEAVELGLLARSVHSASKQNEKTMNKLMVLLERLEERFEPIRHIEVMHERIRNIHDRR